MSKRKKTPQRRSKPGVFRPATRVTEDELLEVESLLEAEDPDDADEAHMLVLDLEDKYPFDEVVLRLLFQTGLVTEDYESMERAAVRLHRSHPRDPLVLISLGTAYLSATRPALTLRTWGTFLKLWPEREEAVEMRKEIEGLRALVAEYMEVEGFEDVLQLEAHEEAESLIGMGDFAAARRCAAAVLARWPNCIHAINDITATHMAENEYRSAASSAAKAVQIDPQNIVALASLVQCHRFLGNLDLARSYAERLRSSSAHGWGQRLHIATGLIWVEDYAGILQAIDAPAAEDDAKEDEPAEMQALLAHFEAVASLHFGHEDRARQLWSDALEFDPELLLARANLDDLDWPFGERFRCIPLTGSDVTPGHLWAAIKQAAEQTAYASDDAIAREYRKLVRKFPDFPLVANVVFDIGDPISVFTMLSVARRSADPAMLAEVRRFALGKRGLDSTRMSALSMVQGYNPNDRDPVKMWLKGEWTSVGPLDVEKYQKLHKRDNDDDDDSE